MLKTGENFIEPLFSKVVYGKQLDIDTKKIISIANNHFKNYNERSVEGQLLDQTQDLYVLNSPMLEPLKEQILKEFNLYISTTMKWTNEFRITTSWFTKSIKGQSAETHNHNNCMYSGVLYLQTDENTGNIQLCDYENKRYQLMSTEQNIFNCTSYSFSPTAGMLIFFPSEVWHSVDMNKSNITRYSMAFNLVPTGKLGNVDSSTTITVEK